MSRRRQRTKAYRLRRSLRRKGYHIEVEATTAADRARRSSPRVTLHYYEPGIGAQRIDVERLS